MEVQSPLTQSAAASNFGPIVFDGSLDQYQAEPLRKQLLSVAAALGGDRSELVLDMAAVEHVDAASLQVLLAFRASSTQTKVQLKGVSPTIQNWIRIAGADHLFEFVNTND